MKKFVLPYDETGYFSKAVTDYLSEKEVLRPFYRFPVAAEAIPQLLTERSEYLTHRDELHLALTKQHESFRYSDSLKPVHDNINRLKAGNTFTVTTAHQPNLFLGPLYLIYKIISTINLAKSFSQQFPSYHFVPVYWMGSEDHDADELNHIQLFGKTFSWKSGQQGAFGRMKTASLAPLIAEIRSVLGDSDYAKKCGELLEDCYLEEQTIAKATRKMLYHFFAEDGLVIVDGDDAILKRLFMPVIENELLDQFSFPVVNESIRNFSENYPSQISPREINLFYLDTELRQRIVKEGDKWKVLNTGLAFSEEQLKDLIHSQPEKFSPNVVLRPMYQELVLPNIAFIGGGAEVTYWLELKPLFDAVELHYPMILLRNSALWIDRGNSSRMQKLSVEPSQIFQPEEQLIRDYLQRQTGSTISLEEEKKSLSEIMEQLLKRTVAIDASLKGAVEAEAVKMQKSLDAVEDRIRKSLKKREEISVQQIHTLKERLFPANGLQERHDNFMSYYTRYGDEFFEALKSAFDPLAKVFTVLVDE